MNEQDWIVVIALFVLAVGVAYSLGSRRRPAEHAAADKRVKVASVPPSTRGASPAPPSADESTTKATVEVKPAPAEVGLAKMEYEEDEEIDPTKVGAAVGLG